MSRAKPIEESEDAAALPDRARTDDPRRPADAAPLHDPPGPAQRLRHRPQPQALGGRRHPRDHQAALRGRAARRARPRAHPHPQPRHPDPVGRLGDRRRDHLPRLHAALVRQRRQVAARPRRLAGDGPAGADRGERSSSSRSRASASTRPTPAAPKSAATPSPWPAPCCASSRGRRRCRCRSTRRPSRSTSSSPSRARASPASSRPTPRSRSGSNGCARCARPVACAQPAQSCSAAVERLAETLRAQAAWLETSGCRRTGAGDAHQIGRVVPRTRGQATRIATLAPWRSTQAGIDLGARA